MSDWVTITGATSGIGLAFAEQYVDAGDNVFMVARHESDLKKLQAKFQEKGVEADYLAQDLSERGAAEKVFKAATKQGRVVKVLVNNAGYTIFDDVVDTDADKLRSLVDLNVGAFTDMARYAAEHMKANGGGKIINLSSTAAYLPGPKMAAYHASRSYVLSFSVALREELINDGVFVTAVCPGRVATGFQKRGNMETSFIKNRKTMTTPELVAEVSREAVAVNKAIVVPDWRYKLIPASTRLLPFKVLASIMKRTYEK